MAYGCDFLHSVTSPTHEAEKDRVSRRWGEKVRDGEHVLMTYIIDERK